MNKPDHQLIQSKRDEVISAVGTIAYNLNTLAGRVGTPVEFTVQYEGCSDGGNETLMSYKVKPKGSVSLNAYEAEYVLEQLAVSLPGTGILSNCRQPTDYEIFKGLMQAAGQESEALITKRLTELSDLTVVFAVQP